MSRLVLVDLSSVAHPIYHTSGTDPDVDATSRRTVERIRALAQGEPHVAICCDSGRSFRRDIDKEYKANRPASDAALMHQIDTAIRILRGDGFPVWSAKGYEADDLIASAVASAVGFSEALIHSSDKDLLQLVGDVVTVQSLTSGAIFDAAAVNTKFGVAPHQFVDFLSLVGDTADNIKGAKGIGPKKAAELLAKYGNLDDMFVALTQHATDFTPGLATSLREFQARMKDVRALVTLRRDVPVPIEEVLRERIAEDAVFSDDDEENAGDNAPGDPPTETALEAEAKGDGRGVPDAPVPVSVGPTGTVAEVGPQPPQEHRSNPPITAPPPAAPRTVEVLPAVRDEPAHAPDDWNRQLEPRSMAQAKALATDLFAARLFSGYGNAPAVLAIMLAGRELGMSATASLRGFHIIDGKPVLAADLIRALVIRSGQAAYFRCTERTPERATFATKRGDDPELTLTVTMAEAQQAGLVKKGSAWEKNPADMLVARAGSKLARLVYPDVVHGLYAREEME